MKYYFLGIAGTAMAAVAVLMKQKGHEVWGTDQGVYPPMSDFLAEHEIPVWEGYDETHLEKSFDRVVIGNAMSRGNPEVEAILNRKLPFISMPELIRREFIDGHNNIVITGTHGKTTTTTLMAWMLESAGLDPGFLIGGIARNFDSSIQLGSGKHFIIEGDEYDCAFFDKRPKFVHYFPDYLVLNNLEFDHADIYPDLDAIKDVFRKLMRIIPQNGLVVANGDSPAVRDVTTPIYSRIEYFGAGENNDWRYVQRGFEDQQSLFEILHHGKSMGEFQFPFPGEYQLQNVLAVVAVARDLGIDWKVIRTALASFQGVKRRLEFWGKLHQADVYDDFAHHPSAIAVTLNAMKQKFPSRRLVALFEPRTNTTVRNVFQDDLCRAFDAADVVLLSPIHRLDRIPKAEQLSVSKLLDDLRGAGKSVQMMQAYGDVHNILEETLRQDDLLVLLTNGSLGGEYQKLRAIITGE